LPICKGLFIDAKKEVENDKAPALTTTLAINKMKDRCSTIKNYINVTAVSSFRKRERFYNYFSNISRRK
jgi:hypothetical protein